MKKILVIASISFVLFILAACGGSQKPAYEGSADESAKTETSAEPAAADNPSYDPKRGEGKFKDVELSATLDAPMAEAGSKVADVKCMSCHKLTDEKLVGPGWKNVTTRRSADWIMNFITNTEAMIDKDPAVQAQLEICMVRMPNQSLGDDEARHLLEFMRKNDGVK